MPPITYSPFMCSRTNRPCPARCNAWTVPCEDAEWEADDLDPARGVVYGLALSAALVMGALGLAIFAL